MKLYESLEALRADPADWLANYNGERTHQGKIGCGRTSLETLGGSKRI